MNFLTILNPTPIFNPPNIQPLFIKSPFIISKSISGSYSGLKLVSNSNQKMGTFVLNSRLNLGYCSVGKRVSWESFGLKNGDSLMKVNCGGVESESDEFYMRKGVELAKQAIGWTSPNPLVGCVIVKDGKIVGQGFHPKAGQPHAEVFALREAGDKAENATAYVTLEPCNHYGKTPPCAEALIEAKVKKVVVGMVDPNPIVCSRGIDRLREAGIEVYVGMEEDLCKNLNEGFIHKMLSGKPFVTLRYSISINGVILDQLGDKVAECGGYYSKLLQEYDAVIHTTSTKTSLLSSQEPNARQPLHIYITNDLDSLNHNFDFISEEADCKAIVFSNKEETQGSEVSKKGIETVVMDHVSLDAILEYCSRQGMCNVLVDLRGKIDDLEHILGQGFETNSMQKVVVEVLPVWTGNEGSHSSSMMTSFAQNKRLKNISTRIAGDSVLLEGYF